MPLPALDFPNPPLTVGQTWAGTNGIAYTWDGAVWTATAASGGGGGGPPTGPAGGDLAGTYPNPTIGPLAVGNAEISDVAYSKVTGGPTSLPPNGAAGGDLQGTYPNPTLGPTGAIAGGYGSSTQWVGFVLRADGRIQSTSLYTLPTSLPPSGVASGDLTGTYPGPTVAKVNGQALTAGDTYYVNATPAITRLAANATATNQYLRSVSSGVPSWQQVAYADVAGTPTALPPSGAAGGDLQGTYPNPTINPTKLPWTPSGGTLTPTDATKAVTIPASTGATIAAALTLSGRTVKERIAVFTPAATAAQDGLFLSVNRDVATGAQDDTAKSSWQVNLRTDTDNCTVQRSAPAGATTTLLSLDPNGTVSLGSAAGVARSYVSVVPSTASAIFCANTNPIGNAIDNTSLPAWQLNLGGSDVVRFFRSPAGTTASYAQPFLLDNAGNLTITGATATKASGTTWANPSDRRLKEEITDYPTGLAAILALVPRTFVYNGKAGSCAGQRGYGFIADEVAAVMPEMVGTARVQLEPDDPEPTEIQTLDTSNLVLALVNAVQELAAQIQELREGRR